MAQVRIDNVTKSRLLNGTDANGQPIFAVTYAVSYTILSNPPVAQLIGYHRSQFAGLTKDQIRALILADIKALMAPSPAPNDASADANITPGESVAI